MYFLKYSIMLSICFIYLHILDNNLYCYCIACGAFTFISFSRVTQISSINFRSFLCRYIRILSADLPRARTLYKYFISRAQKLCNAAQLHNCTILVQTNRHSGGQLTRERTTTTTSTTHQFCQ